MENLRRGKISTTELVEVYKMDKYAIESIDNNIERLHHYLDYINRIESETIDVLGRYQIFTGKQGDEIANLFNEYIEYESGENHRQYYNHLKLIRGMMVGRKPKGEHITDEQIEIARDFPIDSLIKFNDADFACCVFHAENTPSMKYYPDTNRVHCFGCGVTRDAIQVYMHTTALDFVTAIKNLSK